MGFFSIGSGRLSRFELGSTANPALQAKDILGSFGIRLLYLARIGGFTGAELRVDFDSSSKGSGRCGDPRQVTEGR